MYLLGGLIFILSACEDDEQGLIIDVESESIISFNPPTAVWFQRTAPDSFIVNISGGTPPYIISERGEKIDAQVSNNKLILFPRSNTEPFTAERKTDFINITDNAGNINTLNINLDILRYKYSTVNRVNLDLTGDTNISVTQINSIRSYWDSFQDGLTISLSNSSDNVSLSLQLDSPVVLGPNPISSFNNYSFKYFACTKNYVLRRPDTVYVTALSEKEVSFNFDVDIGVSLVGNVFGNYSLKGDVELSN